MKSVKITYIAFGLKFIRYSYLIDDSIKNALLLICPTVNSIKIRKAKIPTKMDFKTLESDINFFLPYISDLIDIPLINRS